MSQPHWIVCVGDSPEGRWTLHDTLEEAVNEYNGQIGALEHSRDRALYDETYITSQDYPIALCAVYKSRYYQSHPELGNRLDTIINYIQDLTEDHGFAVLRALEDRFGWAERNPDTEVGIS
jgi:hypothetical protein